MSFEAAYGYYTQGNPNPYHAGSSAGQGFYYPPGMTSYGPQVGPSSSAQFDFENPIMRSISELSNRVNTLGLQQQQMSEDIAHNLDLAQ